MDILGLVGAKIRQIRKAKGITQEQLAERIETSHSYIGLVERGSQNITLLSLARIAEALDIDFREFFEFEGFPFEPRLLEVIEILDGRSEDELKRAKTILENVFPK